MQEEKRVNATWSITCPLKLVLLFFLANSRICKLLHLYPAKEEFQLYLVDTESISNSYILKSLMIQLMHVHLHLDLLINRWSRFQLAKTKTKFYSGNGICRIKSTGVFQWCEGWCYWVRYVILLYDFSIFLVSLITWNHWKCL